MNFTFKYGNEEKNLEVYKSEAVYYLEILDRINNFIINDKKHSICEKDYDIENDKIIINLREKEF